MSFDYPSFCLESLVRRQMQISNHALLSLKELNKRLNSLCYLYVFYLYNGIRATKQQRNLFSHKIRAPSALGTGLRWTRPLLVRGYMGIVFP